MKIYPIILYTIYIIYLLYLSYVSQACVRLKKNIDAENYKYDNSLPIIGR